jgi:hypothetical protein
VAEILRGIAVATSIIAFVGIIPWSCGHDQRLRERIARDGCAFNGGADVRDLSGAREREFYARYCID